MLTENPVPFPLILPLPFWCPFPSLLSFEIHTEGLGRTLYTPFTGYRLIIRIFISDPEKTSVKWWQRL